jgi:3-oxoacyl-[acyl-carrier-protein] synthase III
MIHAKISCSTYHLPERILGNDELAALYPDWSADKILQKTGIRDRHIAALDETAADLAHAAALKLLSAEPWAKESIDFLIFCSQTPDYFLPSSSCVLQHRLDLARSCGAIDINQGCSGFVYSLSVAKALIESAQARCVLILTADTYSKLIHPMDKSTRTIFGDAGAATLVVGTEDSESKIAPCLFGTDGSGRDKLIVPTGGFREARTESSAVACSDESGNSRARDNLYMDGADVLAFTLREVPPAVRTLLERGRMSIDDIDHFIFHQGSRLMLETLRRKSGIPAAKFVFDLEDTGNTVSSTLPIALSRLLRRFPHRQEQTVMLVGFGVGYSWAGTIAKI